MASLFIFALAAASSMPRQNSVALAHDESTIRMHGKDEAAAAAPLLHSRELLAAISTLVAHADPATLRSAEELLALDNTLRQPQLRRAGL